ncbi:MAG: hypothetical protein HFI72_02760 [Peptococcaceae bacterium]|nr:hypothetical protein [Peptococcaceae bacterium]
MMSKNSYSNPHGWFSLFLMKDCCKRTLWAPALYFVALFFALPVTAILSMQHIHNRQFLFEPEAINWVAELHRRLAFLFGTGNGFLGTIFVITAFVSALTVFFYLHKKKRVDFFHSLPIKRETFFFSHYIAGILFILIPYVLNLVVAVIAVFSFGYGNYLSIMSLVLAALQHLLFYIFIYTLGIATAMLTGNLIVHGLLFSFLLIVGPALVGIYYLIVSNFYPLYYLDSFPFVSMVANSSPLAKYIEMLSTDYLSGIEIFIIIAALLLLILLGLLLYKKRPSDCAGLALAFPKTKPFFQWLITLVISIYMGFAFYDLGRESIAWLCFGIICGGLITSRIVEVVYAFDFRAIKKNLLGTAIFLGLTCGLLFIPIYDLTGFNDYMPAKDEVAAMKIQAYGPYEKLESPYYSYSIREENSFIKSNKYLLTTEENLAAAYKIATIAHETRTETKAYTSRYDEKTQVLICYQLTNGKKVYREYYGVPIRDIKSELATILGSNEFKENYYTFHDYTTAANTEFTRLHFFENDINYDYIVKNFNRNNRIAILEALKIDTLAMPQAQWEQTLPIGYLRLEVEIPTAVSESTVKPYSLPSYSSQNSYTLSLPIYPCYTHTMAALAEAGIRMTDAEPHAAQVDYIVEHKKIKQAEISTPAEDIDSINTDAEILGEDIKPDQTSNSMTERTITDRREISEIMSSTYPMNAFDYHPFAEYQGDTYYTVYFIEKSTDGYEYSTTIDRAYPQK